MILFWWTVYPQRPPKTHPGVNDSLPDPMTQGSTMKSDCAKEPGSGRCCDALATDVPFRADGRYHRKHVDVLFAANEGAFCPPDAQFAFGDICSPILAAPPRFAAMEGSNRGDDNSNAFDTSRTLCRRAGCAYKRS